MTLVLAADFQAQPHRNQPNHDISQSILPTQHVALSEAEGSKLVERISSLMSLDTSSRSHRDWLSMILVLAADFQAQPHRNQPNHDISQ